VIFILLPFISRKRLETNAVQNEYDARMASNVRIFKERKRELTTELRAGRLSQDQFDQLVTELDDNLVQDAQSVKGSSDVVQASRKTALGLGLVALLVVSCSLVLYSKWGAYDLANSHVSSKFSQEELAKAQALAQAGDTRGLLIQLRDKLQGNEGNIEGWMLLAKTALNSEQFDIAAEAYRHLADLEQDKKTKAAILGLVAQAEFFRTGDIQASAVQSAINQAFAIDPNEVNTLGLLAISSFERAEYRLAVDYWERILEANPNYSSADAVREGIHTAKLALGEQPSLAEVGNSDDGSEAKISIRVRLDPTLQSLLSGQEQLVVFAKAVVGPPMPLAVSRSSITAFPEKIVLDDSLAMMPELKLSGFDEVNIVARITSGSVELNDGDYEIVIKNVSTSAGEPLNVVLTPAHRVTITKE